MTVSTVGEQTRRDMLDVEAGLEVVATRRLCHVAFEQAHLVVRYVAEGTCRSDLEVGPFASVASGDIPEVVFTP